MATTCKLIAKNVLGSNAASVTFSSIPATYDDLLVVASPRTSYANTDTYLYMKLNGNSTTSNPRYLRGNGANAASGANLSNFMGFINGSYYSNLFASVEIYIPNYAGSENKSVSSTCLFEQNETTAFISVHAGIYGNSAVTSIEFTANDGNFVTDSSFFLYGIKKA